MPDSPVVTRRAGTRAGQGAVRILVIEDHTLVGQGLEVALRSDGFAVERPTEGTAKAVLDAARARPPSLALIDLHLSSGQNGRDLIGPLVELGARVIVVTGETDRIELAACLEAGATGVASKKEGLASLIDKVRRAVDGQPVTALQERDELLSRLRNHRRSERSRLSAFSHLTPRERAVLAALVEGKPAETIAHESSVSMATVRTQIHSMLQKLGVGSQLSAVALARQSGWRPD
ncbi:MAG TPA: response regulator transcription factor [Acidimicrobiales bacterium]|nr:response regulator transcription factor [Acidimicrobiales bacterium]